MKTKIAKTVKSIELEDRKYRYYSVKEWCNPLDGDIRRFLVKGNCKKCFGRGIEGWYSNKTTNTVRQPIYCNCLVYIEEDKTNNE